jgi:hypothetical protein
MNTIPGICCNGGLIMRRLLISIAATLTAAVLTSQAAQALPVLRDCDVNTVTINEYSDDGGATWNGLPAPLPSALPASACLGVFEGNDDVSSLGDNRGIRDVGFLNDTTIFGPDGAFITDPSQLLDIAGDGEPLDAGWVYVGKLEFGDEDGPDAENGTISKGNDSYTFDISTLLEFQCPISDVNPNLGTCESEDNYGSWTYLPPATNPAALQTVLGTDKFFDQAAVVFKGAQNYAIYNFTLAALDGLADPGDNLGYRGEWDMRTQLLTPNTCELGDPGDPGDPPGDPQPEPEPIDGVIPEPPEPIDCEPSSAGLSHVSLWLRDPAFEPLNDEPPPPASSVPGPAPLGLILAGLLGLAARRRK